MYWFARPPWIRWALSTALVLTAFVLEVNAPATNPRWFAVADVTAGDELQPSMFRQVQVPVGLIPLVEPSGFAQTDIRTGDPLTAGHLSSSDVSVPDDWWIIELAVPSHLRAGQAVLLVVLDDDSSFTVSGLAVAVETGTDPFGGKSASGSIAVPSGSAATVAVAAAGGNVTVLTAND